MTIQKPVKIQVSELDHPEFFRSKRAGIIPYTKIEGKIHFLMGVDMISKELSDFGGGVKIRENTLEGAIREFKEESNKVFPHKIYTKDYIASNGKAFYTPDMTLIFLYVDDKWHNRINVKFYHKKRSMAIADNKFEMDCLVWVDQDKFFTSVKNQTKIWKRISRFINNINYDFVNHL